MPLPNQVALRFAPLVVAVIAVLCVVVNPVGFVGGGADDTHYLEAARCWVGQGQPCLAADHWASRWPIVAPLALAISLFGESRATIGLAPLVYWAASIALIGWLGARWFSRWAGLVAALLLAVTPALTAAALQPSADTTEFAFQLSALAAATVAFQSQKRRWALLAGILAGVAFQARETSAVFIAVAALAWLALPSGRRNVLLWAVAGLCAAIATEMIVYAATSGDPLWRYRLAVGHAAIPSDELSAAVDTSRSPLFNPDNIAAWKRDMGIEVAWPLDPWINLFASPKVAQTLIAALLLGALYFRRLAQLERRSVALLIGCALLVAMLLVYGLAVDPKPRMFLSLVAASAITTGALCVAAWRSGSRLFPLFVLVACIGLGTRSIALYPATYQAEAEAGRWIAVYRGQIEIDEQSRKYLILLPSARSLPPVGSGKPLRIATTLTECEALLGTGRGLGARLVDSQGGPNPRQGRICLFEYGAAAPRR